MEGKGKGGEKRSRKMETYNRIYFKRKEPIFNKKKILQYTSERFCSVLNRILFCLLLID